MRLLPVVALGTAVALALGGAAYAATRKDDEPPLGEPPEDVCSSSSDIGQATSEILADDTVDADGLRKAADVLRHWTMYCDDAAEQTGQASIALLEAKADMYENARARGDVDPLPPPAASPPQAAGSFWPVPPGYSKSAHATGLHGEQGTVYSYSNGDQWFYPDNPLLIPYFIPGGSKDILTQGMPCGCGRCIRGEECGCGQ
jgi:hypothetical protein